MGLKRQAEQVELSYRPSDPTTKKRVKAKEGIGAVENAIGALKSNLSVQNPGTITIYLEG